MIQALVSQNLYYAELLMPSPDSFERTFWPETDWHKIPIMMIHIHIHDNHLSGSVTDLMLGRGRSRDLNTGLWLAARNESTEVEE